MRILVPLALGALAAWLVWPFSVALALILAFLVFIGLIWLKMMDGLAFLIAKYWLQKLWEMDKDPLGSAETFWRNLAKFKKWKYQSRKDIFKFGWDVPDRIKRLERLYGVS